MVMRGSPMTAGIETAVTAAGGPSSLAATVHPLHTFQTHECARVPANSISWVCRHRDSRDGSRHSSGSSSQRSEDRRRDGRSSSATRDTHGSRDGRGSWEASTPRRAGGEDEWEMTPATVRNAAPSSVWHLAAACSDGHVAAGMCKHMQRLHELC